MDSAYWLTYVKVMYKYRAVWATGAFGPLSEGVKICLHRLKEYGCLLDTVGVFPRHCLKGVRLSARRCGDIPTKYKPLFDERCSKLLDKRKSQIAVVTGYK